MKRECNLTAEMLRELLDYNAETGEFRWRVYRGGKAKAGTVAGTRDSDGYVVITIDRQKHFAHRLAWIYARGSWPDREIDHMDGVKDNNRLVNLREASHLQNTQNRVRANKNNRSGFLGVSVMSGGDIRASIRTAGRRKLIGVFATAEEAHAAYLKAKAELHPFSTIAKGC